MHQNMIRKSRFVNGFINRKGAVLALSAALLTGTVALAGDGPGRGGFAEGSRLQERFLHRATATLDLSDEQQAKIRGILEASRPAIQTLREQMRTDRRALREAATADNPDKAAVGEAFLRLKADREAMRDKRHGVRDEISAVLTPEQNAKLEGIFEGRRGRFGRHPGRRMGRP